MATRGIPPQPELDVPETGEAERARQLRRRRMWAVVAIVVVLLIIVVVSVVLITKRSSDSDSDAAAPFQAAGMTCAEEHSTKPVLWGCYSGSPWLTSMRWQESDDGKPAVFELLTSGDQFIEQLGTMVGPQNTAQITSVAASVAAAGSFTERAISLDWGKVKITSRANQVEIAGIANGGGGEYQVLGGRLEADPEFRLQMVLSQDGRSCTGTSDPFLLSCDGGPGACTATYSENLPTVIGCDWGSDDFANDQIRATVAQVFSEAGTADTAAVATIVNEATVGPEMHVTATDGWVVVVDDRHLRVSSATWNFHSIA